MGSQTKRRIVVRLLLSVVVICPFFLNAQTVFRGRVLSQVDSVGLLSNIKLLHPDGSADSISTKANGSFSLKVSSHTDKVLVRSKGYRDTLLSQQDFAQETVTIYLQQKSFLLQDVTIVSRNGSGIYPKIQSDKVTYNLKKNMAAAGTNIWTLLGQVPGVQLNNNQIGMVGKGSVKISVDGRLVQLSDKELASYLQSIASNNIDKLEIVQNPSADMDALGNSGIINIVTKRQKTDGYQLAIQSTYKQSQQYPGVDLSENFTYRYKNWDFFFNTHVSNLRSRFGFGYSVDLPKVNWAMTDTGDYRLGNTTVNFGADYKIGKKSSIGGAILLDRYFEKGADYVRSPYFQPAGVLDSVLKTYATYYPIAHTQSYNLHYEWKPDTTGKSLFVDGTYFKFHRTDKSDYEGYMLLDDNDPVKKNIHLQANNAKQDISIYTFRSDYKLPTRFANWKFGTKLNFINTYVNALYYDKINGKLVFNKDASSEYKYTENAQAFYAEGNKKWDNWHVSLGLRGEFTQTKGYSILTDEPMHNNYFQLYPAMNLDYMVDNDHIYSVTFGRRTNRPTFWNLNPYKSMLTAYSYYEGNPYLQPEYTNNVTLQYNYRNRWVSTLYLSLLDNGFGDITIPDVATSFILRTPKNFVRSNKYGFSETFTYADIPWLNTNNSVTVYYTDSKSKLDYVEDRKGWGAYFATNNTVYLNKSKTVSGLVNFWYQMPETNLINRSNHYYSLDLGMSCSLIANRLSLTANVHDLFGTSAPIYSARINDVDQKYWTLQLLRYYSVTATFSLGNNKITQKEKNEDIDDSKNRL
ncbi:MULTISPECIES: TonB-dependent receptor domain-containing protein [Chitinophagaceae]